MRQFLLAGNVAYPSAADLNTVPAGACGFYYNNNGQLAADSDGSHITREGMLVLGRAVEDGGPVVIPIFKNNFSYVKGEYQAGTTFEATVTIPAPTKIGEYSLMVVKKGQQFNYRNKWTSTVHSNATDTVDSIAEKLVKHINANTVGSGMTAVNASGKITFTAEKAGIDYEIIPADALYTVAVTTTTRGNAAQNDIAAIKDMMMKAAADAGFEYTYNEFEGIYPALGGDLLSWVSNAGGYTVYTLKFTEPRMVGTRNDYVNQIVQIAYPTGAAAISTMDSILAKFAGEE